MSHLDPLDVTPTGLSIYLIDEKSSAIEKYLPYLVNSRQKKNP